MSEPSLINSTDGQIHMLPSPESMSDRDLLEEVVRNQRYLVALYQEDKKIC